MSIYTFNGNVLFLSLKIQYMFYGSKNVFAPYMYMVQVLLPIGTWIDGLTFFPIYRRDGHDIP